MVSVLISQWETNQKSFAVPITAEAEIDVVQEHLPQLKYKHYKMSVQTTNQLVINNRTVELPLVLDKVRSIIILTSTLNNYKA